MLRKNLFKQFVTLVVVANLMSFYGSPVFSNEETSNDELLSGIKKTANYDSDVVGLILEMDETPVVKNVAGGIRVSSLSSGSELGELNALNLSYGVASVERIGTIGEFRKMLSVDLPSGVDVEDFYNSYSQLKGVKSVTFNMMTYPHYAPNDPYYKASDPKSYFQWNLANIKMDSAWEYVNSKIGSPGGSRDVIVAVLDTGVAFRDCSVAECGSEFKKAPELANLTFVSPKRIADGFDDALPLDKDGHGTHVTGTIAQAMNNASHSTGIASNVKIIPVKVLGSGGGKTADIIKGMEHAVKNGAKVVNMSLGLSYDSKLTVENYCAVYSSIANQYKDSVIFVASAGNGASRESSPKKTEIPAACDGFVAVGATRYDNKRANYSDYGFAASGLHGVDIVAPGGQVNVDSPKDTITNIWTDLFLDQNGDKLADGIVQQTIKEYLYTQFTSVDEPVPLNIGGNPIGESRCFVSGKGIDLRNCGAIQGTSMATPHVSAVAALMFSVNPNLKATEVKAYLKSTSNSTIIPSYNIEEYGAGLLDAEAAVKAVGGSVKDGDANGDGVVDIQDIEYVADRWGTADLSADVNKDNSVNIQDIEYVADRWGM